MNHRLHTPLSDFALFVEETLGFHGENPTSSDWETIYRERLSATDSKDFLTYRSRLTTPTALREEVAQLAQRLTIGETYFFRDSRQFEALSTVILPKLILRRSENEKVQVLSVACSTGEEPYSVAIAARELLGERSNRIQIHAFDINRNVIERAERAVYSEWALRATPAAIRDRHFKRQGGQYVLSDAVRSAVSFEVRNLFEDDPVFWRHRHFDVILCRNALIYFSRRKVTAALSRLTDVLASGGTIFLGNAESPRGYWDKLIPHEICGSFCYDLADESDGVRTPPPLPPPREVVVHVGARFLPGSPSDLVKPFNDAQDNWVTAIDDATRRLATLTRTPLTPVTSRGSVVEKPASCQSTIADARELILAERFSEALECLDRLVAFGHDPSELGLLRATILTNQGRLVEAMEACRRLLTEAPHCAGAHHLLGVACEHSGRHSDARLHHELAVTLEPKLAMSHWFLGRLLLRAQQRDQARRHLATALEIWDIDPGTSTSDTSIFSGGFGREALMRLCRRDLANCETRQR